MKKWFHKIEILADKLIPYALIVLLFVIIAEVLFPHTVEPYHLYISIIDGIVIGIFAVDLGFKYVRSKNIPQFFRKYWIEIIAVLPAFLVVRIVEEFMIVANLEETFILSQEALEVEARAGSRASRLHYFARFVKPLARLPRFLKAFKFYERPWL
jgi:xanthine/uracil permease